MFTKAVCAASVLYLMSWIFKLAEFKALGH
jgi:hypothetical protein